MKIKKVKFSIILIIVFATPRLIFAAPTILNISGTYTDAATVTITGNGFGSRNDSNMQWLGGPSGNIESGEAGSPISLSSEWIVDMTSAGRQRPEYSTTYAHSGTKSIKAHFPIASQYSSGFTYNNSMPFKSAYVTWWFRPHPISWAVPGVHPGNAQFKLFRISPGGGGGIYADQTHNWAWTQQMIDNGEDVPQFDGGNSMLINFCKSDTYPTYDSSCYAGENPGAGIYRSFGVSDNIWQRIEVWTQENTVGSSDGTILVAIHKQDGAPVSFANYSSNTITRSSQDPRWQYIVWENYWGNGVDKGEFYFDDVYFQIDTQARVEICSESTWAGRSHCEIQIPSNWSDGSITFTANQGSFIIGNTIYLYVVDENGEANTNGYSFIIGEGPTDVTAPNAPSGLSVI